MRLGGYFNAGSIDQLEALGKKMDVYGASAIGTPDLSKMSDDDCKRFGEKARSLGFVIGESGVWANIMTADKAARQERINMVRTSLKKADIMGCHSIVTLAGTRHDSDASLAPHKDNFSQAFKDEFREVVLKILDGLNLKTTKYIIEPWHCTFFYQPEDIKKCIDRVDHPAFGLHLDQMNMVNQEYFFNTTKLINKTFDLLGDKVFSVHLKDIRCDHDHMFLKWDEVYIGDGVMDYDTYLKRLDQLHPDLPCYCEHMAHEQDYALCFARLHHIAKRNGLKFLPRKK